MRKYRVFVIGRDGRIDRPSLYLTYATDEEAVEKAREIAGEFDFEVWEDMRIIARAGR